jgi:hypothetical protein
VLISIPITRDHTSRQLAWPAAGQLPTYRQPATCLLYRSAPTISFEEKESINLVKDHLFKITTMSPYKLSLFLTADVLQIIYET